MDDKLSKYTFDEIEIGMQKNFKIFISEDKLDDFAKLSGDDNPLHMNEEYASSTSFKNRVHAFPVNTCLPI